MAEDWMDQELDRKARVDAEAERARKAEQEQEQLVATRAPATWRALCDAIKAHADTWNENPKVSADNTRRVTIECGYAELCGGTMIGEPPWAGRRITGRMNIEERNTEWCYSLDTTLSQPRVVDTLAYPIVVQDGDVSIGASTGATAEALVRRLVKLILES